MDNKEKIRLAINQIPINNCDGSANEDAIKAIRYLQEVSEALTIPDVVSTFICDYCKDKGSIAYWHKTGMGIKPCKCRKTN